MSSTLAALGAPDRLAALSHSGLLDSVPEEVFDRLTRMARRLLGAPVALVSLVTDTRQFFKSVAGAGDAGGAAPAPRGTPLSHSFCKHVVAAGAPLVVDDARAHPLVCDSPATRDLRVRAYAGVPLALSDGRTLGSFCAVDTAPRHWSADDVATLRDLAAVAASEIEARVRAAEKAAADRALAESARRFRATFEQAAVGIAHLGVDGRWLHVNERLCEILGYAHGELLARTVHRLTHPADRPAVRALVRRLVAGEVASHRGEVRFRHRGGDTVWAMLTASLVLAPDGSPDYFIAVVEDVGERKRAELALRETEASLRTAQAEVIARLAQAAELRDDDTGHHTQRVGELSARIAAALGLPAEEVALIRQAAPLHDVGKIGVADAVLLKRGGLTPDEGCRMRAHTTLGARLLAGSSAPLILLAESIARAHHEHWDGAGYPQGLAGDAIPLAARIVAVADVFDALTSDRPYRAAWPPARALAYIRERAGAQFDPAVVAAFARACGASGDATGAADARGARAG